MTQSSRWLRKLPVIVILIAFAMATAPRVAPAAPSLAHLQGVAELKSWFNSNRGHPRLLLLLSPT